MSELSLVSRVAVPSLRVEVETWRHPCGLTHFHLACDDEHRAFAIAFRTQPHDDTGLPHILEHTTLCGSRRYPVRDPFFNMLRRSLQTFMNAMTYPDLTAYPFASQVAKDFDNLLDVYLDAVFAPNLHPLDFAQEGHRLAPTTEGGWERAGVVFNEMKGAMNGTSEQLSQATSRALLPDTPYRHNYGGEPTAIPALTRADLVAFHQRCYRAGNAAVFTYGRVDVPALHGRLQPYIEADIATGNGAGLPPPPLQTPLSAPVQVEFPVPQDEGQDEREVSAAALTWIWGDGADLDEALTGELIDRVLLGHAGAPLRLALESSGLGRSLDGSGFSSAGGSRNAAFSVQLNGVAVADYPKFEPLVMTAIARIADQGVSPEELTSALHQLELSRREIHGDSYPHGLELCFRLLSPWNLGVDPLPFVDQSAAIARLKQRFATPVAFAQELRQRFVQHAHRGVFTAQPDPLFLQRQDDAIDGGVAADVATADAVALTAQAEALAARQASKDDATVLPDLELSDVPAQRHWLNPVAQEPALTIFAPGTNGILHHLIAVPLPALDDDSLDLLPIFTQCVGQLGVGALGYAERAAWLSARCAGVSAWTDIVADPVTSGQTRAWWLCEVRGLAERSGQFAEVLANALDQVRFDEHDRLRELLEQSAQRLAERVQGSGNAFAVRAAMRGFGGSAALGHRLSGLGRLAWLKRTVAALATPGYLDTMSARLDQLRRSIASAPRHTALIGDVADREAVIAQFRAATTPTTIGANAGAFTPPGITAAPPIAYLTATAVNYCALAYSAVPLTHPDAAAMAVAGRLLGHQVLHPRIREQGGAYGASAGYSSGAATFTLSTYRDPRLAATFEDLRYGVRWLRDCPTDPRPIKEAVLGVIADLDTPASPAGEARGRFSGELKGVTPSLMDAQRQRVLAVTAADVRRAAERWLDPYGGSPAVVTGQAAWDGAGLPWTTERI